MVCQYCFFNHEFELQDSVCNGCNDLAILCLNISDVAITTVKGVDCRCIIYPISKFKAINLSRHFVDNDYWYI